MPGWWMKHVEPLRLPDLTKLNVVGMGGNYVSVKVGANGNVLTMDLTEFVKFTAARCGRY
jgi:hypothetical protein